MAVLRMGAAGKDVKAVQDALNDAGYKVDSDGILGPETEGAIKDFQKKLGLTMNGIVDSITSAALNIGNAAKKNAETKKNDGFKVSNQTAELNNKRNQIEAQKPGDFTYGEYQESDLVKQAQALLQQQLSQKPGEYQSAWQSQLDEVMNKIMNREKFSYDLNGDALYQQYKDMYTQQGKMAMMDTMGQAQAMTGGYGNSYAQSVGQQAYQGHLQQLNDKVPELYQLALDKYNMEGQEMLNQYAMLGDRENQDYGRYRDTVSDYYTELDRLTSDYRYASEQDYGRYIDDYNMKYGEHRDAVSDWQNELDRADSNYYNQYDRENAEYWNKKQYDYQVDRDKVADKQWQKEFDLAHQKYQDSLNTGGDNPGGNPTDDPAGDDKPEEDDKPKEDDKPTRDSIEQDLNDFIAGGADKSEINNYLRSAYQNGHITYAEYLELKETYAPKGYTFR